MTARPMKIEVGTEFIVRTGGFSGTLWGRRAIVEKVHKNGNVRLSGESRQFKPARSYGGETILDECGNRRSRETWVKLTPEVVAEIAHDKETADLRAFCQRALESLERLVRSAELADLRTVSGQIEQMRSSLPDGTLPEPPHEMET